MDKKKIIMIVLILLIISATTLIIFQMVNTHEEITTDEPQLPSVQNAQVQFIEK